MAMMATNEAHRWFSDTARATGASTWRNEVTKKSVERQVEYFPASHIDLIAPKPLLIIAGRSDELIPLEVVQAAFDRAGEPKRLEVFDCGHFALYDEEPWHSRAVALETEWFLAHL